MAEQAPILLLESEEGVIKDVTASLRLVGITVLSKPTIPDLKNIAKQRQPVLVLTRCRVAGNDRAGLQLVEDFANEDELRHIPVIILCTPSEESILQDKLGLFKDALHLPVEFPYFTEEVQRILHAISGSPEPAFVPRQAARGQDSLLVKSYLEQQPNNATERDKLLAAYEIQMQVLEKIKRDRRINAVAIDQIPDLIADETRIVCDNYKIRQK